MYFVVSGRKESQSLSSLQLCLFRLGTKWTILLLSGCYFSLWGPCSPALISRSHNNRWWTGSAMTFTNQSSLISVLQGVANFGDSPACQTSIPWNSCFLKNICPEWTKLNTNILQGVQFCCGNTSLLLHYLHRIFHARYTYSGVALKTRGLC